MTVAYIPKNVYVRVESGEVCDPLCDFYYDGENVCRHYDCELGCELDNETDVLKILRCEDCRKNYPGQ